MRLRLRLLLPLLAMTGSLAVRAGAQDPAQVEALAPLVAAEDRREFDPATLSRGVNDPDPLVRRIAVTSIGRIGDRRGTGLLLPLLSDRDPTVVASTFFALGLLRDSAATGAIASRLRSADSLSDDAIAEAATALTRIGGGEAARFIGAVLAGTSDMPVDRHAKFIPNAILDGWHLGALMPAAAMLHYASDTGSDLRWRTMYALGRMRIPAAGSIVMRGMRETAPSLRETAAKWLTHRFADTAGIAAVAAKNELVRALSDDSPGVRTNAVGSLATFADSSTVSRVVPLLTDADPNVRVAAATALGEIRGSAASRALGELMDRRDATWALQRAALLALARCDSTAFAGRASAWLTSTDFRNRIVALQAYGGLTSAPTAVFRAGLADADPRVQAAALEAWRTHDAGRRRAAPGATDTLLLAVARTNLRSTNEDLRAAAADALRPGVVAADLDLLTGAWRLSIGDAGSDARLAILATLHALIRAQPDLMVRLDDPAHRDFVQRPDDPVVRAEAERSWPEVARRWGSARPVDTRRSLDDYRSVVRTYLLAADDPHVTIDVEGRGSIDIQLLGHEAPLTVANFLRLVDRHYFDHGRWHRVVPNFVVQDGDPTGTGNGGPGWSIRDEINRERYIVPMVGMALSGPDTGGSQWFINLSAQPHLDGQYTIFGKVAGGFVALARIVQGDMIRSIHR